VSCRFWPARPLLSRRVFHVGTSSCGTTLGSGEEKEGRVKVHTTVRRYFVSDWHAWGGRNRQCIKAGTLKELLEEDMGGPLHSLIICGDLHDLEMEVVKEYLIPGSKYVLPGYQ
jgi:hypothetical protein